MAKVEKIKKELEADVKTLIPLQDEIAELQQAPEVVKYLQKVDSFKTRESVIRKTIQDQMEKNSIKSIKGDWGYMTIVEKNNYKAEDIEAVPRKFVKRALDTVELAKHIKLVGSKAPLPKGIISTPSRSLTIRLKKLGEEE